MENIFIDGVNVICQVGYWPFWILALIVIIAVGVITIFDAPDWISRLENIPSVFIVFTICGCLLCPFMNFIQTKYFSDVYKVTIDENVSYADFTEKYNVISEKNGVYTISLKGDFNE